MGEEAMFADSLLETSRGQRTRRGWTTVTSFGLEALVIGLLLLVPLWKTVGLPSVRSISTPVSLGRPDPGPAPRVRTGNPSVTPSTTTTATAPRFLQPTRIPTTIQNGGPDPAPPIPSGCGECVPGLPSPGAPDGVRGLFIGTQPVVIPPRPVPPVRAYRTSNMLEGSLVRRVVPTYPPLARTARIQGPVVLQAVISKAGTIEDLRVISGHPILVKAALDAVSQWRYRPYILNGEPVEVETQIMVSFTLSGS